MKLNKILMATTALSVAGAAFAEVEELVVVSWGGAYQVSQQKAYSEPYTADTGMKFTWDESSGEAVNKLRAMAEAGDITWDLVDATAADAMRLCDEGLARVVDADTELADGDDGSKASADFGDLIVSECFVPQIVYSVTWGFRNDVAEWNGEAPSEICDVFDTEKFPGKRAVMNQPWSNMEWGAYCSGVPAGEVYASLETEEGQEAAIAMWAAIKDDLVFWSAGAETPQLLADGEVVMGSTFNGRLFALIEETGETKVDMLWDAQVYDLDGWIVPADLPEDRDAAVMDFLKFATDTQRLADQAKYISYGPARASSAPLVGQHADLGIDMAPHMPTDPANATNVIMPNYAFWADYRDDLDAKWAAFMAN